MKKNKQISLGVTVNRTQNGQPVKEKRDAADRSALSRQDEEATTEGVLVAAAFELNLPPGRGNGRSP
jgi:hypothetical protein